jgi:hypothetical protein
VLYAWTSVHTSRVRTATESREFRQVAFRIGRAPFNPHLRCGVSLVSTREYRLPGAEIHQHRHFTLRGIVRGLVFRRRSLIFVYIGGGYWHRFNLTELEDAAVHLQLREEIALARRARG